MDAAHQGLAFGPERLGDHPGAFVGLLVALLLVSVLNTRLREIFLLACVPGARAGAVRLGPGRPGIVGICDRHCAVAASSRPTSPCCSAAPAYWRYLLVTGLFGIGNSTNAVLVLYPQETGTILAVTLFVYAFFHLVAALASAPAGTLADHPGSPKWVVFGCFHNFAIVYVGFALGTNTVLFALVIVGYELYRGRYRAMGKSYAAGLVPPELRASGPGLYTTVVGLTGVMAGGVGG